MSDTMISAVVAGEDIYGVAAVTTSVVEQAQRVHGACPTAAAALGRLLTGGALMGCLCKEPEHRIALQITCKGPIQKIHVEADGIGHVRGYPGQPVVNLPSRHGKLDVGGAVGKGVLHVMKDTGLGEPYSGAVPLVSGEIAEDLGQLFCPVRTDSQCRLPWRVCECGPDGHSRRRFPGAVSRYPA